MSDIRVLDIKFERPVIVFKPHDVLDIVEKYCGWDVARYLRDLFDEYENEEKEIEVRALTDLNSYEASLDSNSAAFHDILAEVEELEKEINQTRLNREKIRKRLNSISTIVCNQI